VPQIDQVGPEVLLELNDAARRVEPIRG
jgi:hypothetical protein